MMWRVSLTKQIIALSNVKAGKIYPKRKEKKPLIMLRKVKKNRLRGSLIAIHLKKMWQNWAFFTVTIALKKHKNMTPDERLEKSALIFKKNADRLMKRLRRQYGNFAYIRVLEQCVNGQLHAHFLANLRFLDLIKEPHKARDKKTVVMVSVSPSLKKTVVECGFGWASHAENLESNGETWEAKRVVGYITKYVTKEDGRISDFCRTEKIRKMQTSRHFKSPFNEEKEEGDADWFISAPVHITLAQHIDFSLYDLNRKKEVSRGDYALSDYYPAKED